MGNNLRIDLQNDDVVLVDPKEMLKAMRGWGEYDCLYRVNGDLGERGMKTYGAGHEIGGRRLADPNGHRMQWNVGDILVCKCHQDVERCRNCGREHGIWKRSDGTPIKGQPCPGPEPDAPPQVFSGTLF